jgi:hypothetical protein
MNGRLLDALKVSAIGILASFSAVSAADKSAHEVQTKCEGSGWPGNESPTPADPFPIMAAGWGPELGEGLLLSRWAEDWTGMRAAGNSRPLKAMPIGGEASLTLSAEVRLRYDAYENRQLKGSQDYQRSLFRGILGTDLRLNRNIRVYSEVGTGQVGGAPRSRSCQFSERRFASAALPGCSRARGFHPYRYHGRPPGICGWTQATHKPRRWA